MKSQHLRKESSSRRQPEQRAEQSHEHWQGLELIQSQSRVQNRHPCLLVSPSKPNFRGLAQELGASFSQSLVIQPKLTIGAPNDKYEQEADRVAAKVVQQLNAPKVTPSVPMHSIQRETLPDEDEELQMKPSTLQRAESTDEEEEIQAKFDSSARSSIDRPHISDLQLKSLPTTVQREAIEDEDLRLKTTRSNDSVDGEPSTNLESAINTARGGGQPLDSKLQKQMGQAMETDFNGVKIHTGTQADSLNRSLHSKAFTTKQDIFFRRGEYNPESRAGQELIAHELTHVVQQQGNKNTVQRWLYEQTDEDSKFTYGGEEDEKAIYKRRVAKLVLTKSKQVYKEPSLMGEKVGTLEPGDTIYIRNEEKQPKSLRTWKKFETEKRNGEKRNGIKEGWINTKRGNRTISSIEHRKTGEGGNQIIMPNPPAKVEDIRQAGFGDCFLLAALTSLVQENPRYIQDSLFQTDPTKPAETHIVRFYRPIKKQKELSYDDVKVKNTVLKIVRKGRKGETEENYGNQGAQDWPAVVEKAFELWVRNVGREIVEMKIDPGHLTKGGNGSSAALILTGKKYEESWVKDRQKETKTAILRAIGRPGTILVAATYPNVPPEWEEKNPERKGGLGYSRQVWGGIAFQHLYAVVAANPTHITLRNPWGYFGRVNGEVDKDAAESVLTWDEFSTVFRSWSIQQSDLPDSKD